MPRVLHTADWHLGKRLHDFWLLDEQSEALDRLADVVARERPDLVLIAGDLFDVPVPQVRALQLWERAVARIADELGVPVVVIPGNHDQAERIAMNARMARHAGLHVLTDLAAAHLPVRVGGVDVFGVPFHKPPHVRAVANAATEAATSGANDGAPTATDDLGDVDYDAAMGWILSRARRHRTPAVPTVLAAHAFVEGAGEEPEGEEAILVGGAGGVRPGTLRGFDYVALGHLHRPRTLEGPAPVRYAGSLFPYAFGEPNEKSVTLVDLPAGGGPPSEIRAVPLPARRQVRIVDGKRFAEVIEEGRAIRADPDRAVRADDYLLVRVQDRDPIDHALARLREVHPRALLEQPVIDVRTEGRRLSGDVRTIRPEDAFLDFYESVYDAPPSELELEILRAVLSGGDVVIDDAADDDAPDDDAAPDDEALEAEAPADAPRGTGGEEPA